MTKCEKCDRPAQVLGRLDYPESNREYALCWPHMWEKAEEK